MALPAILANLAALKGIMPPGMSLGAGIGQLGAAGAAGIPAMGSSLSVAPAAGAAGAAGALSAPSAGSLSVAPTAPAPAAPSYTPNPYTNGTGGANAGNPYTNSTGGANAGGGSTGGSAPVGPAAAGAGLAASSLAPSAPAFGGSGSSDQSANINPYTSGTGGANAGYPQAPDRSLSPYTPGIGRGAGDYIQNRPELPGPSTMDALIDSLPGEPQPLGPDYNPDPFYQNPTQGLRLAQNTRTSDWLTGGGGSHAMQGIVNRDPFAARGMESDLGAYGVSVPNTGSLTPADTGLGNRPMSNDPNSARQAPTGFGPIYQANPIAPNAAPGQDMGYGVPTPGYLNQGGSNAIDNPVAAGTYTRGYEPSAQGPGFSGVTRDRLNAATAARPVAAGTPLGGYEPAPIPVAAGTPTRGYDPLTSGTGGANRGGAPAPYLDPTGVLDEVFSGPDVAPAAPAPAPVPTAPISPFTPITPRPFDQSGWDLMNEIPGIPQQGFAPYGENAVSARIPRARPELPGFLEAGGTARIPQARPAQPFDPRAPRPAQPYDAPEASPSNIPDPARVPQPRPSYGSYPPQEPQPRPSYVPGISPFGVPRIPMPRPDPWSNPDPYRYGARY